VRVEPAAARVALERQQHVRLLVEANHRAILERQRGGESDPARAASDHGHARACRQEMLVLERMSKLERTHLKAALG